MAIKHWKTLTKEVKYKNPWWIYIVEKYLFDENKQGEYHYCFTHGSSFIIPVLDNGKFLMVNQYRYLNDRESIEFPGGGIKEGQSPEETARKELIEETGMDGDFEKAGYFNPYSGITNEICHVFIARNLKPSAEFKKDEHEEFELLELSKEEVNAKMDSNEIFNGMSMASWLLAQKHFR